VTTHGAKTIGFIGLGTMGLPMVTNLARAGVRLAVHDVSAAAMDRATALDGVTGEPSARTVAERAEVLFTCLPNDAIVREAYLGPDGVGAGGHRGLVTCDCSTVSPEATLDVHRALAARGISHLDTPMLGSLPQAQAGEIFFIVGGDAAHLPRVEPYLRVMGQRYLHVGPIATGNRIKLMHNGLAAVVAVATAEALATCVQAGVDPAVFYEVVRTGGGMAFGTYWERRAKRIVDGDFAPTFMLQHMLKDASLALDHARQTKTPTPLLEETQRTYAEAVAAGWGAEDFSAVTHVVERRIGRALSTRR
jgi:3-hydroxyisobutyrate dehydrogenase-like beta-hydroxyacid dehydrogenase